MLVISRELPGVAVGADQELAGLRVVENDFLLAVPFKFAADPLAVLIVAGEQRDEAKVARNGRVVAGFDRGDGRFAGLNARDEVTLVVIGSVETHFGVVGKLSPPVNV